MSSRHRILLVDPAFYGVEYDLSLCKALRRLGIEAEIAASAYPYAQVQVPSDLVVHRWFFRIASLCNGLSRIKWLRRVLRAVEYPWDIVFLLVRIAQRRYDCVHYLWAVAPRLDRAVILLVQGLLGIPVVYTAHNALPHADNPRNQSGYCNLYKSVTKITTLTRCEKDRILSFTPIPSHKITVIPHGGYMDILPPSMNGLSPVPNLRDSPDIKIVGFCGVIRLYKGLDDLIRAFSLVYHALPNTRLAIVGHPSRGFRRYEKLMRDLQIPSQAIYSDLRYLPLVDMVAYLRQMDVLVLPYRSATQSGHVVLAYELGIPVIATSTGGLPEQIQDGMTGFLVQPGDIGRLAETIMAVLEMSPDELAVIRRYAKKTARTRFGWCTIAKQTIAVYRSVVYHDG